MAVPLVNSLIVWLCCFALVCGGDGRSAPFPQKRVVRSSLRPTKLKRTSARSGGRCCWTLLAAQPPQQSSNLRRPHIQTTWRANFADCYHTPRGLGRRICRGARPDGKRRARILTASHRRQSSSVGDVPQSVHRACYRRALGRKASSRLVGKIGCPAGNRDDTQRLLVRQFLTNYDFTDRLIIRARWPWRRRSPDSPDGVPKLIPSLGKPGSTAYTSVRDMREAVRRMSSSTWSRRTCSSKGGGAGARPTTQALGGGARGVRTAAFRDDPGRQVHPRVAAAAAAEAAAAATAKRRRVPARPSPPPDAPPPPRTPRRRTSKSKPQWGLPTVEGLSRRSNDSGNFLRRRRRHWRTSNEGARRRSSSSKRGGAGGMAGSVCARATALCEQ